MRLMRLIGVSLFLNIIDVVEIVMIFLKMFVIDKVIIDVCCSRVNFEVVMRNVM